MEKTATEAEEHNQTSSDAAPSSRNMKFSLIMATIGRHSEVRRFLESLQRQSHRDFELIVIDQNRTEMVESLCREYAENIEIRYSRLDRPGVSCARNAGLAMSGGHVIAFPDDDCEYPEHLLAQVEERLISEPKIDGITGVSRDKDTGNFSVCKFHPAGGLVTSQNIWFRHICASIFLRRRVPDSLGKFDEQLGIGAPFGSGEETDLLLRAVREGFNILYCPDIIVYHPDPTPRYDFKARERAYHYGLGNGAVFCKHLLHYRTYQMLPQAAAHVIRPLGGSLLFALSNPARSRFYIQSLKGRVKGFLQYRASSVAASSARSPMKLGFNCRFLHARHVTGVERYAQNLLASMVEVGADEEFVLFGCGEGNHPVPEGENVRKMGSCAWRARATRHLWEQTVLPGLATEAGVDLLINPINTAPLRFPRNILVVHDLSFLEHPEWFSRRFRLYYRIVVPRMARRALAVVTVSEFSKDRIVRLLGVAPEKVHVVYQAASPAFHQIEDDEVRRVSEKLGLSRPYLLFVGSVSPRKNLTTAIDAFNAVTKRLPGPLEMLIVGVSSKSFPQVRIPAGREKDLRPMGYVDDEDLPGLYAGAKALVYPSLYEGFGLPPLEAMACGTPVITSNCSSLPEVVGDAALLVDPRSVRELEDALYRMLTDADLSENLRKRGLERAKRFSWEDSARRMIEICRGEVASCQLRGPC